MPATYERDFEDEFCEHLADNDWFYSPNDDGYDRNRAIFSDDVLAWLEESQPKAWAKAVKPGTPSEAQNKEAILAALATRLDTPMVNGGGTLKVLRGSVAAIGVKFQMCQFAPPTTKNEETVEMYRKVRVRVIRQVHFSPIKGDNRTIDLVLFVNGLPVATLELKTDFKQNIADAIRQYKKDRDPKGEPLLEFGRRALVHFAVSDSEVWMTTKLEGKDTYFLPFNKGHNDGAGNPPNPNGAPTAYLWENVLQRDSWLSIVGSLMFSVDETKTDPITEKVLKTEAIRFPRYHQWNAVRRLLNAVRADGMGKRYLIQHSAGSGKSNTIGWTAHRMARLHDENNDKVFDTVLVITDRTVLDSQLQMTVSAIDGKPGLVLNIDKVAAREAGGGKSAALSQALEEKRLIVVVTVQTFPFALKQISENAKLASHRFALIIDEAHSSQSGSTAKKVREVLKAGGEIIEEGAEVDSEDAVNQDVEDASTSNVSYFAFTATPKPKTLEIFGTDDENGKPHPFDSYTMKQAIEEGFILDVLKGYQSYKTAFEIAENISKGGVKTGSHHTDDGELVDAAEASKAIKRFVRLHPTNIAQKVRIIVEHFNENVADLLDGHAKAMVVTSERRAALRYKVEIDKYVGEQSYDLNTLVAYSGSLTDPEYGVAEPTTELGMNDEGISSDLAEAFQGPEYRVMIAADKFQVGFDQPLLCAMYVDKALPKLTAVQTLSRLNRTYKRGGIEKDRTFILDFVNKPEDIQQAFEQYFEEAEIEGRTDPNLPHIIAVKLEQALIYTDEDVEAFWEAYQVAGEGTKGHAALAAAIGGPKDEFDHRYKQAEANGDKIEIERLDQFRKDVGTFVRLYDFMSQVYDYGDTGLEQLSVFLRELSEWLKDLRRSDPVDISEIRLKRVTQIDLGKKDLSLSKGDPLEPIKGAGSGIVRDPKLAPLREIIEAMNTLFGSEFDDDQTEAFVISVIKLLAEMPEVRERAEANSEDQFVASEKVDNQAVDAVLSNREITEKLTALSLSGVTTKQAVELIKRGVYRYIKAETGYED
jgi:type I restriction enzyme, R subunit